MCRASFLRFDIHYRCTIVCISLHDRSLALTLCSSFSKKTFHPIDASSFDCMGVTSMRQDAVNASSWFSKENSYKE